MFVVDDAIIVVAGSLLAAAMPTIMAYQAPKGLSAAATPILEGYRQNLRKEEAAEKKKEDRQLVVGLIKRKPKKKEEDEVDLLLDAVDWPAILQRNASQSKIPVGPGSQLNYEDVWPGQRILVSGGELEVLRTLLQQDDKREYALVVRRLLQWQGKRREVLGL
jgi:hypothetical protein